MSVDPATLFIAVSLKRTFCFLVNQKIEKIFQIYVLIISVFQKLNSVDIVLTVI